MVHCVPIGTHGVFARSQHVYNRLQRRRRQKLCSVVQALPSVRLNEWISTMQTCFFRPGTFSSGTGGGAKVQKNTFPMRLI